MSTSHVKRAFKYRFYPTDCRLRPADRTFGCVRKVYNLALQPAREGWSRDRNGSNYNATCAMLTAWKKSEELAYLREVSCVPLQQCLRHLQGAFAASGKNETDTRVSSPVSASRARRRSTPRPRSDYGRRADAWRRCRAPLAIVWSRPLPKGAVPSTVTRVPGRGRTLVRLPAVRGLHRRGGPRHPCGGRDRRRPDHLLTLSTGEKIANPRHEREDRARLAKCAAGAGP